ncbi:MAG: DUF1611 domain-containing protein [Thermoleophilia bacterium]|nr:DUF1611 domain-containing protein [Thermoleophilia bacterium]
MSERLAILAEGLFDQSDAKTGHGVLRFGDRDVVCVVDSTQVGKTSASVVPFSRRDVPIVADVNAAQALGATTVLIGIAPGGGKLTPAWRETLLLAMSLGLNVEAGLHTLLSDDAELVAAAAQYGVEVRDLRTSPVGLSVPRLDLSRPAGIRVVHTVGTDCAIGKMTTGLELADAAKARGRQSVFVATGQTGIAITGWGIAVDHVIADYIAGAAERLIDEGATRGDLLFLEGQGSLIHPGYSGVTQGLLHGAQPDVLVLQHLAGQTVNDDYRSRPIPPLPAVVRLYEQSSAAVRPAPVAAVALNTKLLDDAGAQRAIEETEALTGLVTDDVVRNGPDRLLDAVLAAVDALG